MVLFNIREELTVPGVVKIRQMYLLLGSRLDNAIYEELWIPVSSIWDNIGFEQFTYLQWKQYIEKL